jgi:hypothetical protein
VIWYYRSPVWIDRFQHQFTGLNAIVPATPSTSPRFTMAAPLARDSLATDMAAVSRGVGVSSWARAPGLKIVPRIGHQADGNEGRGFGFFHIWFLWQHHAWKRVFNGFLQEPYVMSQHDVTQRHDMPSGSERFGEGSK